MAKSIEEQVEDWCKNQLENYFTKTESINSEIDKALKTAPSKKGGSGQNLPDIKCFVSVGFRNIPVMIECKGTKGDFAKTDENGLVSNTNKKGETDYTAITKYAINGAIHYAKSILDFTETYKETIAIGVNGYKQDNELQLEIGVYYLSKDNLAIPKKIGDFSDLSFLKKKNLKEFFEKIDELKLTPEEIESRKLALEDEIETKLKRLNQTMHDDLSITVKSRVMLIVGLIMAGLGVEGISEGLKVEELKGELGKKSNDAQKIIDKVEDFLRVKNLPEEKREAIMHELSNVFKNDDLYKPKNGESKLRKVYVIVHKDILPYLTSDLPNIDFTGRLFNVLNDWVDVPDGAENDVVLTPRYVTELMAKLTEVNMNSYVWDYATGSAGFLISAMHLMIADAKNNIKSPEELRKTIAKIKAEKLLGIEKLPEIYILAVLNMILMGDGSSNIINGDSTQFDGRYKQGKMKDKEFPANVFLLNPPYSAPGKGLNFVDKSLSKMKSGKAAVLIQENAGSTQGDGYTKKILNKNTLIASIHMSTDLFIGKSSVQTAIYVFDVGIPHDTEKLVKFIDFSNDGYARQNRKKSSQSVNLKDADNAKERYAELVNLVVRGKGKNDKNLNYYKDCYVEDYITREGNDWTYSQHKKIDIKPTENDFKKIIKEYMAWQISSLIKNEDIYPWTNKSPKQSNCILSKKERDCIQMKNATFKAITIGSLFDIHPTKAYKATNKDLFKEKGKVPVVANSSVDNGIGGWTNFKATEKGNKVVFSDTTTSDSIFYQPNDFVGYPHVQGLYPYCNKWDENSLLYFITCFRKSASGLFNYGNKFTRKNALKMKVFLPVKNKEDIDFSFMETFISAQKKLIIQKLTCWLEQQKINNEIYEIARTLPQNTLSMIAEKKHH